MDGAGQDVRPPPPGGGDPRRGFGPRVRRPVGYVATVVAAVGGVMWALSFVPGAPTASFWSAVVIPCFVLVFPIFFVMVLDNTIRTFGQPDRQTSNKLNLPGWRAGAAGLIFVGVWLASATAMFSGHLSGQPFERDGRFFSNNHGVVTELTREQWADENALSSRLFAGGVLVFAGIAALSLTAPEPAGTGDDSEAVPGK